MAIEAKGVLITWYDAATETGWFNKEEIEAIALLGNTIVQSLGWLVYEDDVHIILAGAKDLKGETFLSLQKIPKGMVGKIEYIE